MNILVTGGLGFIGSHTVCELIENKYDVTIVDNLSNSKISVLDNIEKITNYRPSFYQIDLLNITDLEKVFKENNFDGVIHFAGLKAVGESVSIPLKYYENNITGSLNLYKLMVKYNVNNLIFSSSATVYGDNFKSPLKEDFGQGNTTNPYGSTKLMNENILKDLSNSNPNLSIISLRYFNPVGAHKSGLIGEDPNGIPNNLVPYIGKVCMGELDHLNIFGNDYNTPDGTGIRDYIHVSDLARAHVLSLEYSLKNKGYNLFNVGTGKGSSVFDVLHSYEKACGHKINYEIAPRRSGDVDISFADVSKAKEYLKFEAKYNLDDMCKDSYYYLIHNK